MEDGPPVDAWRLEFVLRQHVSTQRENLKKMENLSAHPSFAQLKSVGYKFLNMYTEVIQLQHIFYAFYNFKNQSVEQV